MIFSRIGKGHAKNAVDIVVQAFLVFDVHFSLYMRKTVCHEKMGRQFVLFDYF